MSRLRILALAPDAHPESISTALVGYAHAASLARHHDVTLVVRSGGNEEAVRRAAAPFKAIVGVRVAGFDECYAWSLRRIFRYDYGSHALTAFMYPFALAFEWCAWRLLRSQLMAREFDAVIRLLPVTSVLPSPFAYLMRHTATPFIVGPINGGLPWPSGFVQVERQREWISGLRNVCRVLPFARSTYRRAAAIIAGSSCTCDEFGMYSDKVFFVPENGIEPAQVDTRTRDAHTRPLSLIFVGRLVPYKACDLALRGSAALLRRGATLTIVGDGPDRAELERLATSLGISRAVTFCGWVDHDETLRRMRAADVLVFPSLREFGGGVVFEALASGVVPIVAAFGGPGDIVNESIGFAIRLSSEQDVVDQIQQALGRLDRDRAALRDLSARGLAFAREHLTWDAKARTVAEILQWTAGRGPRPDLRSRRRPVNRLASAPLEPASPICQESSVS